MAEVVNSLFGITPESLQAQRDAAVQAQALQYAQLDPFQRATASIYAGANKLGGAIGGMLGAQDPAMAQATQRQTLLQQAQPQDAAGWRNLAKQLWEAKDVQGAQEALTKAQAFEAADLEKQKTLSVIAKNTAEQRAAATPAKIQEAETIAAYKQVLRTLKAGEQTPDVLASIKVYEDKLAALEPAEKSVNFGELAERYAKDKFGKAFKDLTSEQAREVNKKLEELDLASKKAGKTDVILPGQQVPQKEWLPFAEYLDKNPLFKKSASLISAAPAALETIRMSTSNDIAAVGFAPMMARMAGEEGALSAGDVNRWLKTGGLDDRLVGSAVTFLTGRPTVAKKEQAEKYVSAMFRGALLEQKRTLQDKAKEFGYLESPNYKARLEAIDAQLAQFKKPSEMKPADSVVRIKPTGNPLIDKYLTPP